MTTPTHRCPAGGCTQQVRHDRLMCAYHWSRLPRPLQNKVYETFRGGPLEPPHVKAMDDANAFFRRAQ